MASPFALRARRPHPSAVRRLARRGEVLGLDGLLARLDRDAEPCAVPGEAVTGGLTWDQADRDDRRWMPQGVACARGGEVLLVAWYAKRDRLGRTPGSRVSVVDRRDPARPRYRHVRLVVPRLGRARPVAVHAGGLAVAGGLLHVADTLFGLRVFRLDDLLELDGEAVLPELHRVRVPLTAGRGRLRWSFVSVGDGSLVVGEYGRKGSSPRLARYALDPATGLPEAGPPREVHEHAPLRMQGVAVAGGTWVVSASTGTTRAGDLHVGRPGAFVRHRGVLPPGPEDLDWSVPGERLWCATEHPGARWVFEVDVRPYL